MNIKALEHIVPAVFSSEAEAKAAMDELRELGFTDNDFGIMVPDPTHYDLLDKPMAETLRGLGRGGIIGAPLGALAGISVITMIVPPLGFIGVGGALLYGTLQGALWGAYVGSQVGMAVKIHHLNNIERPFEIPLKPNEIMVVVAAGKDAERVCSIMNRHGGRCCQEPAA